MLARIGAFEFVYAAANGRGRRAAEAVGLCQQVVEEQARVGRDAHVGFQHASQVIRIGVDVNEPPRLWV